MEVTVTPGTEPAPKWRVVPGAAARTARSAAVTNPSSTRGSGNSARTRRSSASVVHDAAIPVRVALVMAGERPLLEAISAIVCSSRVRAKRSPTDPRRVIIASVLSAARPARAWRSEEVRVCAKSWSYFG